MIDIESIKSGVMVPRVTSEEREKLANPQRGLMVYDLDVNAFTYYDGKRWKVVGTINEDKPTRFINKMPVLGFWLNKKKEKRK